LEVAKVSVDVPTFLTVMVRTQGFETLEEPVSDADVTSIVEFDVADPISPDTAAATTPPAARTAAMMMKRSILWLIARRLLVFISG